MNVRERIKAVLNFQHADRLPCVEWASWWDLTIKRWLGEGLPAGMNGVEIQKYFGLDPLVQQWFGGRTGPLPEPKFFGGPILSTMEEYLQYHNNKALHNIDAIGWPAFDHYKKEHDNGDVSFWMTFDGFFWFPRLLLGIEPHLYSFYDQPELLHRMNRDQTDFCLQVLEKVTKYHDIEFMTLAEDMSYNHGPMLSKEHFDEFLLPYYRELVPAIQSHGIKVLIDSDGDISDCLAWFREAGIEGILPLEHMAGVDVNNLRERYPDAVFFGGYDKRVMHLGEQAMRQEFERILPAMKSGGFIPSVDHQTPPDVDIETYRLYVSLLKEYAASV